MQYDIGDAPLERPKEEPKKALDPDEEKKLSGDMRELYDRLLPSPESDKRRLHFVDKLGRILRKEWPGNEFHVHLFGSSGNMLCTSESDGEILVETFNRYS
jgi:DNA polymerase sigma